MISFDNIVKLNADSLKIDSPEGKTVELITHGHFDHLPTKVSEKVFVCSDITKKMLELRRNKDNISMHSTKAIKMLDSGHTLGSKMFLVNNELLFTGDFNTEDRYCGKASPIKCSTLIIESTFAKPNYIFPKSKFVVKDFKDYLGDNENVTISAYSFGKAQEICFMLEKMKIPFYTSYNIQRINEHLNLNFKHFDKNAGVILTNETILGFKRVALSGWAIEHGYERMMKLDKGFVLSDHCDYPSLIEFVKKCNPDKIYTYHGFNVEMANDLRKIGFDAVPILNGQKLLSDFI